MNLKSLMLAMASAVTLMVNTGANAATVEKSVDVLSLDTKLHFLRVNTDKGNTTSVVYVADNGDTLLIDPNFNGTSQLIEAKMAELGSKQLRYLTSSHDHLDHVEQYNSYLDSAHRFIPNKQRDVLMEHKLNFDVTYQGQYQLTLAGDTIEFSTLPSPSGHTDGDQLVYFSMQKALYVGDYYFANGYPIIDATSGDIDGYLNNINYIVQHFPKDTQIIPGHTTFYPDKMATINLAQLSDFRQALLDSIAIIEHYKQQGATLNEIQEKGLPEQFSSFKQGLAFVNEKRWIAKIYQWLEQRSVAS